MKQQQAEGEIHEGEVVEIGVLASLSKAEIDMQIATARRYPRSVTAFRKEALEMVTLNEAIAGECVYALPRGGKTIEGPSARFGEVIANSWGNCRASARVVSQDSEFVTAQGIFHDLERNVAISYEVQRRIVDSGGRRYNVDMIGVTANAACSIALRNAILKGVPKAYWNDIYQKARQTIRGDFTTLTNRRAEAIKQFLAYGINKEQLLAKLELRGVEDIDLDHLVLLAGMLTAIKDGDSTPEEMFSDTPQTVKQPKAKVAQTSDDDSDARTKTTVETGGTTQQPQTAQQHQAEQRQGEVPAMQRSNRTTLSANILKQIKLRIESYGVNEKKLLAHFAVKELGGLEPSQVDDVLSWIEQNGAE